MPEIWGPPGKSAYLSIWDQRMTEETGKGHCDCVINGYVHKAVGEALEHCQRNGVPLEADALFILSETIEVLQTLIASNLLTPVSHTDDH